jgi:hypothetical protein
MIIGRDFAWAHIAKTGGDATAEYFMFVKDRLGLEIDAASTSLKHRVFPKRVHDRKLYLNIRRLPGWYLSFANHVARFGLAPEHRPLPRPTTKQLIDPETQYENQGSLADYPHRLLGGYTRNGKLKISGWFRMEFLLEDILTFLQSRFDVDAKLLSSLERCQPVNRGSYDHDWQKAFSESEIRSMYLNNPAWTSIERKVYGGLPIDLTKHQ